MKVTICCLLSFATSPLAVAQDFGREQILTTNATLASTAVAADLDGDGDQDILSAARGNGGVVEWFENQGNGLLGAPQIIPASPATYTALAVDLDGDLDLDVLMANGPYSRIEWAENLMDGTGIVTWAPQQILVGGQAYPTSAHTDFIDQDGVLDLVFTTWNDGSLWWCRGLGTGSGNPTFDTPKLVHSGIPASIRAISVDLDADGDMDIVSNGLYETEVRWFENDGQGGFKDRIIAQTGVDFPAAQAAADLDADGDLDLIFSCHVSDVVVWFENDGSGGFPQSHIIFQDPTYQAGPYHHAVDDLDGDGDQDIVLALYLGGQFAYLLNDGLGTFSEASVFSANNSGPEWTHLADITGNGQPDLIAVSLNGNKIAWFENLGFPDCNDNGVVDSNDIANGAPDCNGDGIPDECEIAGNPTLDWNGDGILDVCTPPNYCTANPNSTGLPAVMSVSGSPIITDNNFTLTASQMPTFEYGYFLMAETQGFIPNVGGSGGNLCLGFPFYRFNNWKNGTGAVLSSGAQGTFSFSPNLTNLPQGAVFMIGETWDFQAWYRDGAASTSNFTDGIEVMFR